MKTKTFITSLTILVSLFFHMNIKACDRSSLTLNSVSSLPGGQYRINLSFCTGAGQSPTAYGADQDTRDFAFYFFGAATVAEFPATLTSPLTSAVFTANSSLIPGALVYRNALIEKWACIQLSCGAIQTVCTTVEFVTTGLPDSIRLTGMEGAGNYSAGCGGPQMRVNLSCSALIANAGVDRNTNYGYGPVTCINTTATAQGGIGTISYLWNTGSNSATLNVCPTVTTVYTVTVTDSRGCTATDQMSVIVRDIRCGNALNKVRLCFNGSSLCVPPSQVNSYLNRGAVLGSCGGNKSDEILDGAMVTEPMIEAFPNPFSSSSTIRFSVPEMEIVNVDLYDLNGSHVKNIFHGQAEANQDYETSVDGSELSAGIYLYKFSTESGMSQTSKLVLQK